MWTVWLLTLVFTLSPGQEEVRASYIRAGDEVEEQFRAYSARLDAWSRALRELLDRHAPEMAPLLGEAPLEPVVYGYQLLPRVVDAAGSPAEGVATFSYSWPLTRSYIEGEQVRLRVAEAELKRISKSDHPATAFSGLIEQYRDLIRNQRTVDQYIAYNRFWQRLIAEDRPRFDRMTQLYQLMKTGSPGIEDTIREALGRPHVPSYVEIVRPSAMRTVIRVPLFTDIGDDAFLIQAKAAIEEFWRANDGAMSYAVEIDVRYLAPAALYPDAVPPKRGEHLSLREHAARFPEGAILTTGAEFTHAFVGRYVALGLGNLSKRTLAHEFGHLLGFRDGYIRGYRDAKESGFEILELTTGLDDIMSAPRQGRVQPVHFRLILESLEQR